MIPWNRRSRWRGIRAQLPVCALKSRGNRSPVEYALAWFWAVYLMATSWPPIRTGFRFQPMQLQKQLGLGSYKSARLLCGKLRAVRISHRTARRSPPRCMAKPTAGRPTPAPPTSGTCPMSSAPWSPMSVHGVRHLLPFSSPEVKLSSQPQWRVMIFTRRALCEPHDYVAEVLVVRLA
jgi:hypothetical protein